MNIRDILYGTVLLVIMLAVKSGIVPDMVYGD